MGHCPQGRLLCWGDGAAHEKEKEGDAGQGEKAVHEIYCGIPSLGGKSFISM